MTPLSSDAIVVGAGLVGAACADALAAEGLRVRIVEADLVGGGATAASMGHLVVMDGSGPQFALTRYSLSLWDGLAGELPAEAEYRRCGTIWVAADGEEMEAVRRKHRAYGAGGVAAEILDAAALAEAEPNLRAGLAGGLRVPGDGALFPPVVARWMVERAVRQGAKLLAGTVTALTPDGVRLKDGTALSAGLVVLATGERAPELAPGLPVRPRKGHLVITDRYPGFQRHQLIELGYLKSAHAADADSVAFNVQPRVTGQLLVGSSRQFGEASAAVDLPFLGRMLARAAEYMPGLARVSAIRAWAGFRAATPDKLPLIGPAPGGGRLWVAAGHEGLGITLAPATARLLADLVTGRTPKVPCEPYSPSRFPGVERRG